jgi:hypothetical protein
VRKRLDGPAPPPGLRAVGPREWMHVWARVIAKPSVKQVGVWCAHFADYQYGHDIKPGIPLLQLVCGERVSNKTVGDALGQMRDWGFLWRYYSAALSGIKDDRDIHRLTFPDDIDGIPMLSPDWQPPALAACGQLA